MRVHYVAAYMAEFPSSRANTIHIMRMCDAFAGLDHEVVLYVRDLGTTSEAIFDFYGLPRNFTIVRLRTALPKFNRIIHAWKSAWLARRAGCDVLVSRTAIAAYGGALMGIPVVFDAHGPVWELNMAERASYSLLRGNSSFVRMTVNSSALKEMYERRKMAPPVGIVVAQNGASPGAVLADVYMGGRRDALQVGYTGHLYPGRGIEIILKCAEALSTCDFHIIGGTKADVTRWMERSPPNVHFHGFVNPALVASYTARLDVLLAPYQRYGVGVSGGGGDTSSYMNPIKVIEYVASGSAIIASDLPTLRDILPDGAALFAEAEDAEDWIKCIIRLKDFDERVRLSRACLSLAASMTWERRAMAMID